MSGSTKMPTRNDVGQKVRAIGRIAQSIRLLRRFSALGHKRTNHGGPKTTFVRFGPIADIRFDGAVRRLVAGRPRMQSAR